MSKHRITIIFGVAALVLGAATTAVALATHSPRPGAEGAARKVDTAVALSPAQHCESSVLVLLGKSATAVQQGYPDGISPDDVLAQLGESSPVYEAFMQLDGQVVSSAGLHGAAGSTGPAVQAQALQLCQRYGA